MTRRMLVAALVVATGCTAQWNSLVRYSAAPAPDSAVEVALYREFARQFTEGWRLQAIYVRLPESDSARGRTATSVLVAATVIGSPPTAPTYWSDTLQHEVNATLQALARSSVPDPAPLLAALRSEGLNVTICTSDRCPLPELVVLGVGFNRDSTMAAVRSSFVCGGLCGRGETVVYARHPGSAWKGWWSYLEWIS